MCCVNICFKCDKVVKLELVYILNGSGLVVGCIFVVIVENY